MADAPIGSDDGAQLAVIVDSSTPANGSKVDALGNQYVAAAPLDGFKASYSAAILGLVPAALATDIFTISGSATKTIRITELAVSGTENSNGIHDVQVIKRSAANTGGTSATVTAVPHDSNSAAATNTVLSYTANPTALGTAVGTIATRKLGVSATNLAGPSDYWNLEFGERPSQAIVLRGTAQLLCVNLNGVTINSGSYDIFVEWTEE